MIKNLIRHGIVSSVNTEKCTARVTFPDKDNLVSAELPILQSAGVKNKYYNLVDVGDSVVCLMTPNSGDGTGFILGSFFNDKVKPPVDNQDVAMIRFQDGTTLSYDRARHELKIDCVGAIKINGTRIDLNE